MDFFVDRGQGALVADDSLEGARFCLALERIRQMGQGREVDPDFVPYFRAASDWILLLLDQREKIEGGWADRASLEELAAMNHALYRDILPGHYGQSWANHGFAIERLGKEMGPLLAALQYELRSLIPIAYRGDAARFLIRMELLLEIYGAFTTAWRERRDGLAKAGGKMCPEEAAPGARGKIPQPIPPARHIRDKIRQYLEDYAADEAACRLRDGLVEGGLPLQILGRGQEGPRMRDLYRYGAYISDNETGVFDYLDKLEGDLLQKIADTWTEGYRIGFAVTGKDLSFRTRAGLLYPIGFERIAARAVDNLRRMGLAPVACLPQDGLFSQHMGRGGGGVLSTSPNPQYAYDHQEDLALFLHDALDAARLRALQDAYGAIGEEAGGYAGPLVMETFGEAPFSPRMQEGCPRFSKAQQKKVARFRQEADLLYDKAVIGRERSFTIIAFPVPEIARGQGGPGGGPAGFDEIFRAVIDINTLDYATYRDVQARIIQVLDTAVAVRVLGTGVTGEGVNRTDLTVRLQAPGDPARQTIFENCVADVNIPVGEVFTTPELAGTRGILHVSRAYLNGLLFEDLELHFEDGRVRDYACAGFPTPAQGRQYIEENILFHHETLPMGECAIGTNTTAAARAARLGILDRLPILIAEKTGPHFAVGDTCYSHEEDNVSYNPDGKEIFARDNDYSRLRLTEPDKAYFGCHTDITIPYGEVGLFAAVRADGTQVPIIADGRFVLDGTGFLNAPFQ